MDSTGLTVAWLDAFRRMQSEATQRFARQVPQSQPSRDERALTDVIASAIAAGGAGPQQVGGGDPAKATRLLDKLA